MTTPKPPKKAKPRAKVLKLPVKTEPKPIAVSLPPVAPKRSWFSTVVAWFTGKP